MGKATVDALLSCKSESHAVVTGTVTPLSRHLLHLPLTIN